MLLGINHLLKISNNRLVFKTNYISHYFLVSRPSIFFLSLQQIVECCRVIQIIIVQTSHDVWPRVACFLNGAHLFFVDDQSLAMESVRFLLSCTEFGSIWVLIYVVEELNLNLFIALFQFVIATLWLFYRLFRSTCRFRAILGLPIFCDHLFLKLPPLRQFLFLLLRLKHWDWGYMLEIVHLVGFI